MARLAQHQNGEHGVLAIVRGWTSAAGWRRYTLSIPTEPIEFHAESAASTDLKPRYGERHSLRARFERWAYPIWICLICSFALLHLVHLGADYPNHSPWSFDFAKYTDEGWWGNAAIRAHLLGNWYLPG